MQVNTHFSLSGNQSYICREHSFRKPLANEGEKFKARDEFLSLTTRCDLLANKSNGYVNVEIKPDKKVELKAVFPHELLGFDDPSDSIRLVGSFYKFHDQDQIEQHFDLLAANNPKASRKSYLGERDWHLAELDAA